jgi:Beta-lactamase superfamily domain
MKNQCWIIILFCFNCNIPKKINTKDANSKQYIVLLGIAQDAGYPHPHCAKACCSLVAQGKEAKKKVTCLGIVDKATEQVFMIEATPDFTEQERLLREHLSDKSKPINGILLTHAHIGHYTGLMYLGREAMGAKEMPVFAMPKMKTFLENNAPWSQLVKLKNIQIMPLAADSSVELSKNIHVNYRYPKGNSGFKTQTPQLLPTAHLDFCLASESVPDTDLQVRHPEGSFCDAKVNLFWNSNRFYRFFWGEFILFSPHPPSPTALRGFCEPNHSVPDGCGQSFPSFKIAEPVILLNRNTSPFGNDDSQRRAFAFIPYPKGIGVFRSIR